jgi:hypothetical protein
MQVRRWRSENRVQHIPVGTGDQRRAAFEALKRRGMMASRFRSSRVDAQGTTTGDDSALIELGGRFEEITALVQTLYDPAEPDNRFEEIEATLARFRANRICDHDNAGLHPYF